MYQFTLEILFQIIGIGSASGLLLRDDTLYLISDNGSELHEYHLTEKTKRATSLIVIDTTENIPKLLKPDFEAITSFGNDFYIFGSGSTENRNNMVQYNIETKNTKVVDLSLLYASMQSFGNISPEEFNIEGVVFTGETWYFLQRGNGKSEKNMIFTVQGKNLEGEFSILANSYRLPKIKGVRSSFTDAVLVGNILYFLAAAEDSKSTYEDGEVLGSIIGSIDLQTMKMGKTQKISDSHKFEGIALSKEMPEKIEFLLCEDNDTTVLESNIYKLIVEK